MKTLSVVKHKYTRGRKAKERALAHVNYIQFRPGEDKEQGGGGPRMFFDDKHDTVSGVDVVRRVEEAFERDKRTAIMHKLTLSPGMNGLDMQEYTRELMGKLGRYKGLDLDWAAVAHKNTDHEHVHVVIQNRDKQDRLVRFDKHEYQLMREWGDRYLEREIEPLERYSARTQIEEPQDVMKLLDDKFYRFGDWKFQDMLKDMAKPTAKDASEEERRKEHENTAQLLQEKEEKKRREIEEAEKQRQLEQEEASRLQQKFQEECARSFERRRRMGPQQHLHESRGRLLEWHERYEVQKVREKLKDDLEKDPEQAPAIKEQLEWLDSLEDGADQKREKETDEPKTADDDASKAADKDKADKDSTGKSGETTDPQPEADKLTGQRPDWQERMESWERQLAQKPDLQTESTERDVFKVLATKMSGQLDERQDESQEQGRRASGYEKRDDEEGHDQREQ